MSCLLDSYFDTLRKKLMLAEALDLNTLAGLDPIVDGQELPGWAADRLRWHLRRKRRGNIERANFEIDLGGSAAAGRGTARV